MAGARLTFAPAQMNYRNRTTTEFNAIAVTSVVAMRQAFTMPTRWINRFRRAYSFWGTPGCRSYDEAPLTLVADSAASRRRHLEQLASAGMATFRVAPPEPEMPSSAVALIPRVLSVKLGASLPR